MYDKIAENGIEAIINLYSKGQTLQEELGYDRDEEYLKRMIMSQFDLDKMLLTHKYFNTSFDEIPNFRREANIIRLNFENKQGYLKFDNDIIEALFGNTLDISSKEEYEEWKEFANSHRHGEIRFDTIFLEEEFRYKYQEEINTFKKFFQSFKYKKMQRGNMLEDSYVKKVRKMIRDGIIANPDNTFAAYGECHKTLEKGVYEFENLKELEDISRMTLASLSGTQEGIINIEEECKRLRVEMKNPIGMTKIGDEYRKCQVTLGSESGINNRPVLHIIPFDKVPNAMKNLQQEYEKVYYTEQSEEEYIKQISKIYADFIYIQPYEDGNKRTALCLLNSMMLSKGIIPPPISLTNDERMVEAFYKVYYENNYTMIQDLIIEQYKKFKLESIHNGEQPIKQSSLDNEINVEMVE